MTAKNVVTLFSRPGCHLCEEAREGLEKLRGDGALFELREIDIEEDDALHRELLELIPVIDVDGVRVAELIFEPDAVLARIDTFQV